MDNVTDVVKKCSGCKRSLAPENFSKDRKKKDGLCTNCRDCHREARARFWQKDRRGYRKHNEVKSRYGITFQQFESMLAEQDGKCAICGQPETSIGRGGKLMSLSVDHCHKEGKVRSLLCGKCNTGLGAFKDSISLLRTATAYLELHKEDGDL